MSDKEVEKDGVVSKNLLQRRLSDAKINEFLFNEFGSDLEYDDLIKIRVRNSTINSMLPHDDGKPISSDERERKAEYKKNQKKMTKRTSPPTSSRSHRLNPPPP